jgi:hypothetical protein
MMKHLSSMTRNQKAWALMGSGVVLLVLCVVGNWLKYAAALAGVAMVLIGGHKSHMYEKACEMWKKVRK